MPSYFVCIREALLCIRWGNDMEMMQILETEKDRVMNELKQAAEPSKAQTVLEKLFDRILLQYNEECAEERARDTARYILQAAKMMIPMISAAGETKVWSRNMDGSGSEGGLRLSVPAIACLAGGAVLLVGTVIWLIASASGGIALYALWGSIPAIILGGGLLFWSGRMSLSKGGRKSAAAGDQQVEIMIDPGKIWTCLRAVVLAADKSLHETIEMAAYDKVRMSESAENSLLSEEADLFSGILESAYAEREENPDNPSAQEMISQIRYYLHCKDVEIVEYGGGKREWFELLPGKEPVTLRPALVRDGALIRKGLAVAAQ